MKEIMQQSKHKEKNLKINRTQENRFFAKSQNFWVVVLGPSLTEKASSIKRLNDTPKHNFE